MEGARSAIGAPPAAGWSERRAGRWTLQLVRRARRGESAAFEQIYRSFHQELYRYCLAILRNPADAEDALQATMSAALRSLPGEGREIELRPWLYRVAYNRSISLLRERSRAAEGVDSLPETLAGSAELEAESRERLRALVADLNELPERQRGALVMRELSGLGYAEIGTALECGEGAARQIVYEAREALRMREEGRQMDCLDVRRAISDGDRRRLRGRRLRAHLGACESCAGFEASIDRRRQDLQALFPPLPLAAAAATMSGIGAGAGGGSTGGAVAGGGLAGGGVAGAGLLAGASLKGVSAAAAVVIAAAAGGAFGVVGPGWTGERDRQASPAPSADPGLRGEPGDAALRGSGERALGAGPAHGQDQNTGRGGAPAPTGRPGTANGGNGAAGERGRGRPAGVPATPAGPAKPETPAPAGRGHGNNAAPPAGGASGSTKPATPPGQANRPEAPGTSGHPGQGAPVEPVDQAGSGTSGAGRGGVSGALAPGLGKLSG